jgi:hypothetical protein
MPAGGWPALLTRFGESMRYAPWLVAGLLVVIAVFAVLTAPRDLPEPAGTVPDGGAAAEIAPTPGSPPGETPAAGRRTLRVVFRAIEQVSPIVGRDGVLLESVGIEMGGGVFAPIVARGEKAPITGSFTISTASDDQSAMRVHILRGTSGRAATNHSLGWFQVEGIPPGPAGAARIGIVIRVANDAIMASAVDLKTGKRFTFTPAERPSGF